MTHDSEPGSSGPAESELAEAELDLESEIAAPSWRLLGTLSAVFYGLFTLLPDSHSLMVAWPWVLIWQVALLCPLFWLIGLLWQHFPGNSSIPPSTIQTHDTAISASESDETQPEVSISLDQRSVQVHLGSGLDLGAALLIVALVGGTLTAPFRAQTLWYGWAAFCGLAALYALNLWLQGADHELDGEGAAVPSIVERLLTAQGYLVLAFIGLSLVLWLGQTCLPELAKLRAFRQAGVDLSYNFNILELRNWAPIGHQNYVGGYLALNLPLLAGLAWVKLGRQRWLWVMGLGWGLVDLYTTASRGAWLGTLGVLAVAGTVMLSRPWLPRLWRWPSRLGAIALLTVLILSNQRVRGLMSSLTDSESGGEIGYRLILNLIGWRIGQDHWLFGAGLGSVSLLFQRYLPAWAGREAEWAYQLHSTPAQLWAELGLLGIGAALVALVLVVRLGWQGWQRLSVDAAASTDRVWLLAIAAGLLAYSITSLTDYQLDNLSIAGSLILFLAVLVKIARSERSPLPWPRALPPKSLPLGLIGLTLAIGLWLIPVHRAWQLSSQGFLALGRKELAAFVNQLVLAHQIAPWEPYYPNQLGWNLGNLSLTLANSTMSYALEQQSLNWFQQAALVNPYQEFVYTSQGWLLLPQDPGAATEAFVRSAQLVPAKRGTFYGLGLSLLAQGNQDAAIAAFALDLLRDPLFLTSPLWQRPPLQPLYRRITQELEESYTKLIARSDLSDRLKAYFHQCRGGLRWWLGRWSAAAEDWNIYGTPLSLQVLALSQEPDIALSEDGPEFAAIAAWRDPDQRLEHLKRAWIQATRNLPSDRLLLALQTSLARSSTLAQWLQVQAPTRPYRRQRAGFGVLSRHIDGPQPTDFLTVVENIPMTTFFAELLPTQTYNPELDEVLQPQRQKLIQQVIAGSDR